MPLPAVRLVPVLAVVRENFYGEGLRRLDCLSRRRGERRNTQELLPIVSFTSADANAVVNAV